MSILKRQLMLAGLVISLCATPLASVTAFADNTTADSAVVTSTEAAQVFTIDKAIEYAKANSKTLASCAATEKYQKYSVDEARLLFKNTRKAVNSKYSTGLSDINTSLVSNGFVYRGAKLSYRVAQRDTIAQEYNLKCNVTQAFYGYLSCVNKETYAQEAFKLAQDNVAYAQIRYDGGIISENDLLNFKIAEMNAQNTLNQATRDKEYSILNLKTVLNYPLAEPLNISGSFSREEKSAIPLADALEKSKKSISYANIEDSFALAQEKKKRYQGFYSSNQAAWHSAAAEFANAELTYKNQLEQLTLGIYNAYDAMLTAYESLDVLDKTLEYTQKQMMAAKISYDLGTMKSSDYISATQAYNQIKNSLVDAELGAYIAKNAYESTFDCVNTVFEEDDPLL